MIDFLIKNSLCLSFGRAGEKVSSSGLGGLLSAGGTLAASEKYSFRYNFTHST